MHPGYLQRHQNYLGLPPPPTRSLHTVDAVGQSAAVSPVRRHAPGPIKRLTFLEALKRAAAPRQRHKFISPVIAGPCRDWLSNASSSSARVRISQLFAAVSLLQRRPTQRAHNLALFYCNLLLLYCTLKHNTRRLANRWSLASRKSYIAKSFLGYFKSLACDRGHFVNVIIL